MFSGNLAQVTGGEFGAFNVVQAVNVELQLFEAGFDASMAALTWGRHDRPPSRPLALESDKIYYVNQ